MNDTGTIRFDDGEWQVIFHWKDRLGAKRSIAVQGLKDFRTETILDAREAAMECGYPGHQGGRWNWFVDDSHEFLTKHSVALMGAVWGGLIVLGPAMMIMGGMAGSWGTVLGGFFALVLALVIYRKVWKD